MFSFFSYGEKHKILAKGACPNAPKYATAPIQSLSYEIIAYVCGLGVISKWRYAIYAVFELSKTRWGSTKVMVSAGVKEGLWGVIPKKKAQPGQNFGRGTLRTKPESRARSGQVFGATPDSRARSARELRVKPDFEGAARDKSGVWVWGSLSSPQKFFSNLNLKQCNLVYI